jgi:hypothetical protein
MFKADAISRNRQPIPKDICNNTNQTGGGGIKTTSTSPSSSSSSTTTTTQRAPPSATSTPSTSSATTGDSFVDSEATPENGENNTFKIFCKELKTSKKFKYTGMRCVMRLPGYTGDTEPISWFDDMIDDVLNSFRLQLNVDRLDFVGLEISNNQNLKRVVGISFRHDEQLSGDVVSYAIANAIQSNESFLTDGDVVIKFDHFRREAGFGFFILKNCSNFNEVCRRKKSIVVIDNMDDSLCLARSLVVGMSKLNDSRETFSKIRDGRRHEQLGPILCVHKPALIYGTEVTGRV